MKTTLFLKSPYFFLLTIAIAFTSCKKDKKEDPAPTNNEEVYSQFKATVDGTTVDYKETSKDLYSYSSSVGVDASISDGTNGPSTFKYSSTITKSGTNVGFSITHGTLSVPDGGYATDQEFINFFTTGSKSYTTDGDNGVAIYYYDENGETWSTNGTQTGSAFNLTSINKTTVLNSPVIEYTATFNCTLYDSNGNSKTITNGSAKLSFEDYW